MDEIKNILVSETLLKKLVEEDLLIFKLKRRSFPNNSIGASIARMLVESDGISEDNAFYCVWCSMLYYAILSNDSHYHYSYLGIYTNYKEHIYTFIHEKCKEIGVSFSTIKEITSILHWKKMNSFIEKNNNSGIDTSASRNDKFFNLWNSCLPPAWDLYYLSDTTDDNVLPRTSLFSKDNLSVLHNIKIDYDYVEDLRLNFLWNLLRYYCFRYLCKNEYHADLILESLEHFIPTHFCCSIEKIALPIYNFIYTYNNCKSLLDFNWAINEGFGEISVFDDIQLPIIIPGSSLDNFRPQWEKWRKIENTPKDIHNFIYAIAFILQEGYNQEYDYFYNKLKNSPQCINYLDNLCKLVPVLYNCKIDDLSRYLDQKIHYPIPQEDGYEIFNRSAKPRDIETILDDLSLPNQFSPIPSGNSDNKSKDEFNRDYPPYLLNRKRLCTLKLQDEICSYYHDKWFENVTKRELMFIIFGHGDKPKDEKLNFIGETKEFILFILFLSGGKGKSEVWDYFRERIYKSGKPALGVNPVSNTKGGYLRYEKQFRDLIRIIANNRVLSEKEKEDIE